MLIPGAGHGVTAASLAMSALAEARAEGVDIDDLVETHPVVLALTPPRIGDDHAAGRHRPAGLAAPSGPRLRGPGRPTTPPWPARPCACGPAGSRS